MKCKFLRQCNLPLLCLGLNGEEFSRRGERKLELVSVLVVVSEWLSQLWVSARLTP